MLLAVARPGRWPPLPPPGPETEPLPHLLECEPPPSRVSRAFVSSRDPPEHDASHTMLLRRNARDLATRVRGQGKGGCKPLAPGKMAAWNGPCARAPTGAAQSGVGPVGSAVPDGPELSGLLPAN